MNILKRFFKWLTGYLNNRHRVKFKMVDDVPNRYKDKTIYVVGLDSPWLLTMQCPCGCRRIIQLNTLPEASPCWRHIIDEKKISVKPSIWGVDGCRSHFIIRKGSIVWVNEN